MSYYAESPLEPDDDPEEYWGPIPSDQNPYDRTEDADEDEDDEDAEDDEDIDCGCGDPEDSPCGS